MEGSVIYILYVGKQKERRRIISLLTNKKETVS